MRIRRPLTAALAAAATLPAVAAASPESDLGSSLARDMRAAGRDSGAVVRDQTQGVREVTRRIYEDKEFAASLIPIRDGLICALKLR